MTKLVSLQSIRLNNWIIKASVLDDQILIFFINKHTIQSYCRMFYSEEHAHYYIENLAR